jgi:myo-inositol-1-phosphate synthase
MLKAAIAQMLVLRGLRLRSWYSSNHLGNRDGLVLSDPEFSRLKIADKKRGLTELAGLADADHVVSIDFVRSRGDQKESFDSVVASDIFGREVNLRFNWQGWDSALAVPMLLDLIRLVAVGQRLGLSGPQPQLAYFFKAPSARGANHPNGHTLAWSSTTWRHAPERGWCPTTRWPSVVAASGPIRETHV